MLKYIDFGKKEAEKALKGLQDKYVYTEDMTITEVNEKVLELKKNIMYFEGCPLFVMSSNYYENADNKFAQALFFVRPSKMESKDKELGNKIVIPVSKHFFKDFVIEVSRWVDYYIEKQKLERNIEELNETVMQLIKENDIPFEVQFELSNNTITYVDDKKTIFGLTEETVKQLSNLAIFSKNEMIADMGKERLITSLLACERAFDLRRMKVDIVEELGIKTRKTLEKLIKKGVKRTARTQRVGVGYIADKEKGYIGIIKKEALSEEEAKQAEIANKGKNYLVVENSNITQLEMKDKKTKILITYQLTPYNETLGTLYDIPLSSLFDNYGMPLYADAVEGA